MSVRLGHLHRRSGDSANAALIATLSNDLQEAIHDLRRLVHGIQPPELRQFGLRAAIEGLIESLALDAFVDVGGERYSSQIESIAYFTISEALANVVKHSKAEEVSVRCVRGSAVLVIEIEDNGVGGATVEAGSGLLGLADRAESVGGSIHLHSPAGAGTLVKVTLPCHA
jgi:signal transduction histidine kinase